MTWITPHRDELLRKHGHKYTAAQFASAWDTTRNAVHCRAFRLGISLRKEPRPRLPVKIRAAGVAAVLAGATYRKAAALVGASDCAVWNWSRDAETLGAAYQLLAIAKADACQRRAA